MGADFLESDLSATGGPAQDKPLQYLGRVCQGVGAEQGLGVEGALGISDQLTRSAAATVRWPVAKIALTGRSWPLCQVGLVNSIAKGESIVKMTSGKVSVAEPLVEFGSGRLTLSFYFSKIETASPPCRNDETAV